MDNHLPDNVERADATHPRELRTVLSTLATKTGFDVGVLVRAARDGRLARYIVKPGEIALRRRARLDELRYADAERR